MVILLRPPDNGGISKIGPFVIGTNVSLLLDRAILPAAIKWLLRIDDFVTDTLYTCELLSSARASSTGASHIRYAASKDGIIDFSISTTISGGFLNLIITNNESHVITCSATKFQIS